MTNVVSLNGGQHPAIGEPRAALVSVIEDMLAKARTGELQSFIGTGFTADGGRLAVWSEGAPNVYAMLGAIAWLQHEYVHRHTEALTP